MIQIENLSPMLRMTDAEMDSHIDYGLNGYKHRLSPILRMTNAEIDRHITYGLSGYKDRRFNSRRGKREKWREECQYDMYADDWEREGDD